MEALAQTQVFFFFFRADRYPEDLRANAPAHRADVAAARLNTAPARPPGRGSAGHLRGKANSSPSTRRLDSHRRTRAAARRRGNRRPAPSAAPRRVGRRSRRGATSRAPRRLESALAQAVRQRDGDRVRQVQRLGAINLDGRAAPRELLRQQPVRLPPEHERRPTVNSGARRASQKLDLRVLFRKTPRRTRRPRNASSNVSATVVRSSRTARPWGIAKRLS